MPRRSAATSRDRRLDAGRRRGVRHGLPPRRPPRPVGQARGLHRRQRDRHRERARRVPRGRACAASSTAAPRRRCSPASRWCRSTRRRRFGPIRRRSIRRPRRWPSRRSASASADGFDAMVMRPRLVWGAGDTTLLPEIVAAVKGGKFAWIGGGDHLTATTHVDNVVEGLVLTAQKGRAGRGVLHHRRRALRLSRVRHRAARDPGGRGADPHGPGCRSRRAVAAELRDRLASFCASAASRR